MRSVLSLVCNIVECLDTVVPRGGPIMGLMEMFVQPLVLRPLQGLVLSRVVPRELQTVLEQAVPSVAIGS